MRKIQAFILMMLLFVAILFAVTAVGAYPDGDSGSVVSPVAYKGFQIRTLTDLPGIRSLYEVDLSAVATLEAQGYRVEYGAIYAHVYEGGAIQTPRDLAVTKSDSGYLPTSGQAVAVCVYSSDASASYATNVYVSKNAHTASFAYTLTFPPSYQTQENYSRGFVVAAFCNLLLENESGEWETAETLYSYGEGEHFGTAESAYGTTVSLYALTKHWTDETNPDTTAALLQNKNLRKVINAYMTETATLTFETPLSLSAGSKSDTFTLSAMKAGIYKVALTYTASAKYYHILHYNDEMVRQYIPAGENLTADVYYVHLEEGDNTLVFQADTGAITLFAMTFTCVYETPVEDKTTVSVLHDWADFTLTGTGSAVGLQNLSNNYRLYSLYRLRPNTSVAIPLTGLTAGRYRVYMIGSVSDAATATLRSVVGVAADGGETLSTVTSSLSACGNGSNGAGGGAILLGSVDFVAGANTLHISQNTGVQIIFGQIVLVRETYNVRFADESGELLSVQQVYYGDAAVTPQYKVPCGYSLSKFVKDYGSITADIDITLKLCRNTLSASTASGTVLPPSGVSVDENGYVPLGANQRATVTLTGATAGYYDVYLDFTATAKVNYLDIENTSMTSTTLPRFRSRLQTSEIGTEEYTCTVWLEKGDNTLEIYPEGAYGFALRGVSLVNVADASTATAHVLANTYDKSMSYEANVNNDTGTRYGNLILRRGDILALSSVTIAESGSYRIYALGNIDAGVTLTLSTIPSGKTYADRETVFTGKMAQAFSHGTATSTVFIPLITDETDEFNLSAGTHTFTVEVSSYCYLSGFFLVRVGDEKEVVTEDPDYELPENAIDIYKNYLPDTIAPTRFAEKRSSTFVAGDDGEYDIYVHEVLTAVDELGLGICTVIAHPATTGEYPGVIFIHGGSGQALDFYNGVVDAAKKGYIAVTYDQPSIAAANCNSTGYETPENKYTFTGNPYTAPMYKAVVGGLTTFNLLYTDAGIMNASGDALSGITVKKDKIGINGISYGGYMTTMLATVLGDYVDVAVAKYITGSYPESEYFHDRIISKVGSEEMLYEFCKYFDPLAFAENLTAKFYIIGASKDTYGSMPSLVTFYNAIVNAERRDVVIVPNQNHGTTNLINGANRTGMCTQIEWQYLYYALSGNGLAPVAVTVESAVTSGSATEVTFRVSGEVAKMSLWYSDATSHWTSSQWLEVTDVTNNGNGTYTVTAPMTADFTYYVMVKLPSGDQYSSMATIVK